MAPDTQTIDFNATFLTVGLALTLPFDNPFGHSDDAGSETLSAATKRVDLDDDEDDDEDDEEEDEDDFEDNDEEEDDYEDDEDEDEDLDDEEDEDLDDEDDEDDIKLI